MSEPVDGGEKSGVVYLGRSSFKMKAGVTVTPPAGTPVAPRATPAPQPPSRMVPPRATPTPQPALRTVPPRATPRPSMASRSSPRVTPVPPPVSGVALAKTTLIGLCLMTFSGGIVTTVAIDRYWPRGRPECGSVAPASAAAFVPPAQGFESTPEAPVAAAVAEVPPPAPPAPVANAVPEPAPAVVLPARSAVAAKPAPVAKLAPAAKPAFAKQAPAAKPAAPAAKPAPAVRPAAPAQARAPARKRPTAISVADKPTSPTETWTDPFAPK